MQVCRCLPFIQRLHKMEEMVSLRELRAIVKDKFHEFKDVKDERVRITEACSCLDVEPWETQTLKLPRWAVAQVVDLLIFKGREEIEVSMGVRELGCVRQALPARTDC